MPIYTFKNDTTGEEFEVTMKISEREEYLKTHPELKHVLKPIGFGDSVRLGVKQNDEGFKDVLRKIKSEHYQSNIDV